MTAGSIPNTLSTLLQVRQRGNFWCIPAGIEAMLKCAGISSIAQEDLVLAFCNRYGNESLMNGQWVSLDGFDKAGILSAARNAKLPKANFDTFSEAARSILDLRSRGIEFLHRPRADFPKFKESIHDGFVTLMACGSGPVHIRVIYEYDGDLISAYDPATGHAHTGDVNFHDANWDSLTIVRSVCQGGGSPATLPTWTMPGPDVFMGLRF